MPDQAGAISSKVSWGAAGGAGGSLIGAAVADLLTSFLTSGLGLQLSEKNNASIEILTVAVLAFGGSFLVGYLTPSGLTVAQQTADLRVAKAEAKEEAKK